MSFNSYYLGAILIIVPVLVLILHYNRYVIFGILNHIRMKRYRHGGPLRGHDTTLRKITSKYNLWVYGTGVRSRRHVSNLLNSLFNKLRY